MKSEETVCDVTNPGTIITALLCASKSVEVAPHRRFVEVFEDANSPIYNKQIREAIQLIACAYYRYKKPFRVTSKR